MQRAQRATRERPYALVVDLAELVVSDDGGFTARFTLDPYRRELLLRGLDEIGRTLLEEPRIAAYERRGE
jgi:3-isopropylmalate/(R)-2-methylmalate dehydratase small subunit